MEEKKWSYTSRGNSNWYDTRVNEPKTVESVKQTLREKDAENDK